VHPSSDGTSWPHWLPLDPNHLDIGLKVSPLADSRHGTRSRRAREQGPGQSRPDQNASALTTSPPARVPSAFQIEGADGATTFWHPGNATCPFRPADCWPLPSEMALFSPHLPVQSWFNFLRCRYLRRFQFGFAGIVPNRKFPTWHFLGQAARASALVVASALDLAGLISSWSKLQKS